MSLPYKTTALRTLYKNQDLTVTGNFDALGYNYGSTGGSDEKFYGVIYNSGANDTSITFNGFNGGNPVSSTITIISSDPQGFYYTPSQFDSLTSVSQVGSANIDAYCGSNPFLKKITKELLIPGASFPNLSAYLSFNGDTSKTDFSQSFGYTAVTDPNDSPNIYMRFSNTGGDPTINVRVVGITADSLTTFDQTFTFNDGDDVFIKVGAMSQLTEIHVNGDNGNAGTGFIEISNVYCQDATKTGDYYNVLMYNFQAQNAIIGANPTIGGTDGAFNLVIENDLNFSDFTQFVTMLKSSNSDENSAFIDYYLQNKNNGSNNSVSVNMNIAEYVCEIPDVITAISGNGMSEGVSFSPAYGSSDVVIEAVLFVEFIDPNTKKYLIQDLQENKFAVVLSRDGDSYHAVGWFTGNDIMEFIMIPLYYPGAHFVISHGMVTSGGRFKLEEFNN